MYYPAQRFIRLTSVDGSQVPAFAPVQEADALTAYEPFLYLTMIEGLADLNGDIEARIADIATNPDEYDLGDDEGDEEGYDGYYDEDGVLECTINEDGSIDVQGIQILTRDRIFAVYGVADLGTSPKP